VFAGEPAVILTFCCRRRAVSQPPDPPTATDCRGRQAVWPDVRL